MSGYNGYDFYFTIGEEVLTLPITPEELNIKSGSNNKTVTLINGGDINILKYPSLTEITFEARFPMREYPYSRWKSSNLGVYGTTVSEIWNSTNKIFEYYNNKFTKAKTDRTPMLFKVVRATPNGFATWQTEFKVSLEEYETKESVDDGDDVIVSFKLKEYKDYGVQVLKLPESTPSTTSTSETPRNTNNKSSETSGKTYTVKSGDCLWNIAKAEYGNGASWKKIYDANKTVIEDTAKKHGKQSSSNGHWIYPGTKLTIPPK